MLYEHLRRVEHLGFLLGTTRRKEQSVLRNRLAHREHTLDESLIGIVAEATYLSRRAHVHTQHGVGLLQSVERELAGLDAHVVEVEEILVGLLHRYTQHHLRGEVDKVDLEHFAHKWEGTAGSEVALDD